MSENRPITASFILTLDEMRTIRSFYASPPKWAAIVSVLVFVLGLAAIAIGVMTGRIRNDPADWHPSRIILMVLFIAGIYLFFRYGQKQQLQKAFALDPASNKRIDLWFSHDAIVSKVDGVSEARIQWSSIKRVRRTSKGYLFYQNPWLIIWIPYHAFASQQDADGLGELARGLVPQFTEG